MSLPPSGPSSPPPTVDSHPFSPISLVTMFFPETRNVSSPGNDPPDRFPVFLPQNGAAHGKMPSLASYNLFPPDLHTVALDVPGGPAD